MKEVWKDLGFDGEFDRLVKQFLFVLHGFGMSYADVHVCHTK